MMGFLIGVVVIVVIVLALRSQGSKPRRKRMSSSRTRAARHQGSARDAWLSGDLQQMIGALEAKSNLVDRHFLLMRIVKETYKQRSNPEMADKCADVARLHIEEFERIKPALKREMGTLPRVSTFQQYATLLTERGEFERAVEVCEIAINHGLDDGTKGGYEGRIQRIKKKAAKAKQPGPKEKKGRESTANGEQQLGSALARPETSEALSTAHQQRSRAIKPRVLDLRDVPFVVLPRAPAHWEEQRAAEAKQEDEGAEEFFELLGEPDWELSDPEKLAMADRPDTAYRRHFSARSGTFLVDDLGNAEAHSNAPCSVLSFGPHGDQLAERAFSWDLYRLQVNPLGRGVIGISRNHVLHCYDEHLNTLVAVQLAQMPEIQAAKARLEIGGHELHTHIRTAALRPDGGAYLFSVVDEAFALDMDANPLWGVRMPHQEGWEQVGATTSRSGTSAELERAMATLDLAYPFSARDVKQRYRELAKRWHPDKNPGRESEAASQFRKIVEATELVSGLDMTEFAATGERAIYRRTLGERHEIDVGGMTLSVEMAVTGGERSAADWIYAASFSASGGAFVAGYSGKIVELDASGNPTRLFDTATVPRRIADTGDYLYFLTDTRLYVIRDTRLCRVVDVFGKGELVVGETGFGLLGPKTLRWYTEDGDFVGGIRTKHPLRRVYPTAQGWRAETRQHRVELRGVPAWLE